MSTKQVRLRCTHGEREREGERGGGYTFTAIQGSCRCCQDSPGKSQHRIVPREEHRKRGMETHQVFLRTGPTLPRARTGQGLSQAQASVGGLPSSVFSGCPCLRGGTGRRRSCAGRRRGAAATARHRHAQGPSRHRPSRAGLRSVPLAAQGVVAPPPGPARPRRRRAAACCGAGGKPAPVRARRSWPLLRL